MILTETNLAFPLDSVKPLEGINAYREFCIQITKKALSEGARVRNLSPINGQPLEPAGHISGLSYGRCSETGSLFLMSTASPSAWAKLLKELNEKRQSPGGFHGGVAESRTEHVYLPKLEWIQSMLQIQGVARPSLLEVTTPVSRFASLLKSSGTFSRIETMNEMDLSLGAGVSGSFQSAVMLESLDHVCDPVALIQSVHNQLAKGGILFLTSLLSSGFDTTLLGFENLYFCPPDRTNFFSLSGLEKFLRNAGFELIEVSTPGVLDVEIVQAHLKQNINVPLSDFERKIMNADQDVKQSFQSFLQKSGLSSFARIVGRKL